MVLLSLLVSESAVAETIKTIGAPENWQIGFQPAVTDVMEGITWFHNDILLPITIGIAGLVTLLMAYVMIRFRAKANPEPSKTAHNTVVEIVWTLVPALIVMVLGVIGVREVYFQDAPPEEIWDEYAGVPADEAEVTIKAIGSRWFWTYEYPDENIQFDSMMVEDADLKEGQPRLLTTDTRVVLPVDTVIRIQVTADPRDVIHSWAIPAFGIKVDAVPGRLNERWFRVKAGFEGRYYGQCSELCGERHAFMPITVDIVSKDDYRAWLAAAQKEYGAGLVNPDAQKTTVALSDATAPAVASAVE